MRNELAAVVARKMGRVAVSTRRIPSAGRQAGAAESLAGTRRIRPLTQLLCVSAAALLLSLSACSAGTVLRGLTPEPEQSKQPEQLAKSAKSTQAAHTAQVAEAAQIANPGHHAKKREPKPEPTQQELFEYIRGKLLTLSPTDGFNDNLEVAFDPATSTLSITQPDGRCDIFVNALDTNSAIWEAMDPSDSYHARGDILRLTMTSASGKKARTCYDTENQVDKSISANRVRLVFAQNKANSVPDFTYNMTRAIKKLVVASGGAPEKTIF
jgi:hypothetical protein